MSEKIFAFVVAAIMGLSVIVYAYYCYIYYSELPYKRRGIDPPWNGKSDKKD